MGCRTPSTNYLCIFLHTYSHFSSIAWVPLKNQVFCIKLRGSALLFVTVNSSFCFLSFSGFYVTTRQQPPANAFPRDTRSALPGAGFSFCLYDERGSNRAAAHSAASKATARLCLARGSQCVGMSTVEAVNRKISWLFCFVSHECTVFAIQKAEHLFFHRCSALLCLFLRTYL